MNADKIVQRRFLLKQQLEQTVQNLSLKVANQEKAFLKLNKLFTKIHFMRPYFEIMKRRALALRKIKKLMKRKVQEEKLFKTTKQRFAFVVLIKNCIFMARFEHFLERVHQRLLERGFDKIKENNWIIEERKEYLENIIIKR